MTLSTEPAALHRWYHGIPRDLLDYHEYPIGTHLFADSDWHEHDPGATTEMLAATTTWLDSR